MDWFDRQIVQFVVLWAPFGGPPAEDVLPRFGLTPTHLTRRFAQIITNLDGADDVLDDDDAQLIVRARRLLAASCAVRVSRA